MVNCSVILNTCDAYSDLWEGYFHLLKKYWPRLQYEIILNTESKKFNVDGLNILFSPPCNNKSWSDRLATSLKTAKSDIVLLMMDDFYLRAPVDDGMFSKILQYMSENEDVVSITFLNEPGITSKVVPEIEGFYYRKKVCQYKMTAHITLYRKDFLLNILRKGESAWDFEINGSFRAAFTNKKFIGPKKSAKFVFQYDFGSLVVRGKYYKPVKEYFEKNENVIFNGNRDTTDVLFERKKSCFKTGKLKYPIKMVCSLFKAKLK